MSFPPGLIPQLVREKNVTNPPYSPLSPLDIEALGLPPSTPPDAYLASRLEKFYAELQVCAQSRQKAALPLFSCLAFWHTQETLHALETCTRQALGW